MKKIRLNETELKKKNIAPIVRIRVTAAVIIFCR